MADEQKQKNRQRRLSQQLRANLTRRKQQARSRRVEEAPSPAASSPTGSSGDDEQGKPV